MHTLKTKLCYGIILLETISLNYGADKSNPIHYQPEDPIAQGQLLPCPAPGDYTPEREKELAKTPGLIDPKTGHPYI